MRVIDIVAKIESGDFSSIFDAVEKTNPEQRQKVIASVSDAFSLAIASRDVLINNYRRQLQKLLLDEDNEFPDFSLSVIDSIKDLQSALRAGYLYNARWFNSLNFSIEKKISMANQLIQKVSQFNSSYCPKLWSSIANCNPEIIEIISYSDNKSSISTVEEAEEI